MLRVGSLFRLNRQVTSVWETTELGIDDEMYELTKDIVALIVDKKHKSIRGYDGVWHRVATKECVGWVGDVEKLDITCLAY